MYHSQPPRWASVILLLTREHPLHSTGLGLAAAASGMRQKGGRAWGKPAANSLCLRSAAESHRTLRPHGLWPARLLCPWDFPGKSPGVGCCAFLQGSNPRILHLLHWQAGSLPLAPSGKPNIMEKNMKKNFITCVSVV